MNWFQRKKAKLNIFIRSVKESSVDWWEDNAPAVYVISMGVGLVMFGVLIGAVIW